MALGKYILVCVNFLTKIIILKFHSANTLELYYVSEALYECYSAKREFITKLPSTEIKTILLFEPVEGYYFIPFYIRFHSHCPESNGHSQIDPYIMNFKNSIE